MSSSLNAALDRWVRGGGKWRVITYFDALPAGLLVLPAGAAVDVDSGALRGLTLYQNGYELLGNPGFETAGGGGADVFGTWGESAGDGAISRTTTAGEFRSGTAAAKLTAGASANAYLAQNVSVVPGGSYALGIWSRGDGSNAGRYYVADMTNSAVIKALTSTGQTAAAYGETTYNFTSPAGCVTALIQVRCPTANTGIAYFDDLSLRLKITIPHLLCPSPNMRLTAAMPMPASGVVPRSIWVRGADELNGWEVRITPNTAGNDLSIIEWVAGVQTPRASADVDWTAGAVDNVRVETVANAITVYVMKSGEAAWTQVATWATMATGALNRLFGFMIYDTAVATVNSATWEAI